MPSPSSTLDGERTITTIGERLEPRGDDNLDWGFARRSRRRLRHRRGRGGPPCRAGRPACWWPRPAPGGCWRNRRVRLDALVYSDSRRARVGLRAGARAAPRPAGRDARGGGGPLRGVRWGDRVLGGRPDPRARSLTATAAAIPSQPHLPMASPPTSRWGGHWNSQPRRAPPTWPVTVPTAEPLSAAGRRRDRCCAVAAPRRRSGHWRGGSGRPERPALGRADP